MERKPEWPPFFYLKDLEKNVKFINKIELF
jgi:hypothetical protein